MLTLLPVEEGRKLKSTENDEVSNATINNNAASNNPSTESEKEQFKGSSKTITNENGNQDNSEVVGTSVGGKLQVDASLSNLGNTSKAN